jgi:hypothetical protein|tara:strand:+ start:783 stop:974 length:192 start_codon:yes stop_codon:yes gene_type:complete
MLYQISVPTVIDRIYRVEASSPEEALDLYLNGIIFENEGVVFEEDDSSDAHEASSLATVEEIG